MDPVVLLLVREMVLKVAADGRLAVELILVLVALDASQAAPRPFQVGRTMQYEFLAR